MLAASAHPWISIAHFYMGSFARARHHAECALAVSDEGWADAYCNVLGHDFPCTAAFCSTLAMTVLGDVEAGRRQISRALERSRESGRAYAVAIAHAHDLHRLRLLDRPQETLDVAEALIAIVEAKGIGAWEPHVDVCVLGLRAPR